MPSRIEDYAFLSDTASAALVARDGSIDWLTFPRFDSPACFAALLGDEEHGRWLIAPAGPVRRVERRYRPGTLVLETTFHTDAGVVRLTDCMPVRGDALDLVRRVEGVSGRVPMRMHLTVRFDYGSIVPWVRRRPEGLAMVAGPDGLLLRTAVDLHGEDFSTVAEFTVGKGERVPFELIWHPSHQLPPSDELGGRRHRGDRPLVVVLERPQPERGPLVRAGAGLARRPEGAHLRADRGHRGGRDHVPARGHRRSPELGLPLLLAPRRHLHAPGAHGRRLHRRGRGLAGLAAAGPGRTTRSGPDHVRPPW